MKIIFAQGNPEPNYANTRHNIGFSILNAIANRLNSQWTKQTKFNAIIAEVQIAGEKTLLVKPTTFYNETGMSAQKIIDFYKLNPATDFLAIHDDLSLPFGAIRVRQSGSDAGNNGIKSLNSYLGPDYWRIRIGTYNELRDQKDDADFVLSKFSAEELENIKKSIIPQTTTIIEQFCNSAIVANSLKF